MVLFSGCQKKADSEDTQESEVTQESEGTQESVEPVSEKTYDNSREHFDAEPLPKSDVAGTDANNDHIRDDIEAFINQNYSDKEWTRLAARQTARAYQHGLVWADDKTKVRNAGQEHAYALDCLGVSAENWSEISGEILAQTINTEERLNAYFRKNKNEGGSVTVSAQDEKAACTFITEGLEP